MISDFKVFNEIINVMDEGEGIGGGQWVWVALKLNPFRSVTLGRPSLSRPKASPVLPAKSIPNISVQSDYN